MLLTNACYETIHILIDQSVNAEKATPNEFIKQIFQNKTPKKHQNRHLFTIDCHQTGYTRAQLQ